MIHNAMILLLLMSGIYSAEIPADIKGKWVESKSGLIKRNIEIFKGLKGDKFDLNEAVRIAEMDKSDEVEITDAKITYKRNSKNTEYKIISFTYSDQTESYSFYCDDYLSPNPSGLTKVNLLFGRENKFLIYYKFGNPCIQYVFQRMQ